MDQHRPLTPRGAIRKHLIALLPLLGVVLCLVTQQSQKCAIAASSPRVARGGLLDKVVTLWLPLIGQAVAICSLIVVGLQARNSLQSRFDTFNLDTLKLELDASTDLITAVDQYSEGVASTLDDVQK